MLEGGRLKMRDLDDYHMQVTKIAFDLYHPSRILVGTRDAQPVGVLRRLGSATDALTGDGPELRKEAQDAVGQLPADGPELQDDARAAADERP